jgi:hypothetical protein
MWIPPHHRHHPPPPPHHHHRPLPRHLMMTVMMTMMRGKMRLRNVMNDLHTITVFPF